MDGCEEERHGEQKSAHAAVGGCNYFGWSFCTEWTCGSVKMSGGIGITPGTPWPISNNSFSFTNNLDPDKEMTISGSFDSLL